MSVRLWTNNARGLLYRFEQAVHDKSIAGWEQNPEGLFTHMSQHLKNKAFVRSKVYSDSLAFAVLESDSFEMTSQLFGMYQACLIQSFLTSLFDGFTLADCSSEYRERDGDLGVLTLQKPGGPTPTGSRSSTSFAQAIRASR